MKSEVINRKDGSKEVEESPKSADFLYNNIFGKIILKLARRRFVSSLAGKYMNTKHSTKLIAAFIKNNNIDMSDYYKKDYESFNDFFCRKVIPSKRPISKSKRDLISPADSKMLVYKIDSNRSFSIKGKKYTTEEILRNKTLAKEYENGYFLVFRLSVDDYHRYIHIDDGTLLKEEKINGMFNTVGPVAFKDNKVFSENQREYSVIRTQNFGKIVQMEVGALMVGKIVNHSVNKFKRGDEKGFFLYGGSTVIIMIKENVVDIDTDILENSSRNIETKIKQGETIGKKVGS